MKKLLLSTCLLTFCFTIATSQTGLVAYWPFSGNINDAGPNSITGTVTGPATFTVDKDGNTNNAYQNAGYINFGYPTCLNLGNSSASFSAWFNSSGYSSNLNGAIFNNAGGYMSGIQFGLNWQSQPNIGVVVGGGGSPTSAAALRTTSNTAINTGWHHAVVTIDRATNLMKVYLDCVQQPIQKYTQYGTPSGTITGNDYDITGINVDLNPGLTNSIGAYVASTSSIYNYFIGAIDEVRIYNKALTPTEVCQLFTSVAEIKLSEDDFKIYPNPNNGSFNIKLKDPSLDNFTLKLYNAIGEIVLTHNISNLNNQIEISQAPGFYFLELNSSTKTLKRQAFIINQ